MSEELQSSVPSSNNTSINGVLPVFDNNELKELVLFNDTIESYPLDKTLNILLEEQVAKTPDHLALKFGDESMTYKELNDQSNQVARVIIENGVKPGDSVGLLVVRGFDMIIGMYGILKAGAAYIPVDPEYPIDRQQYILSNSAVSLLITDSVQSLNSIVPEVKSLNIRTADFTDRDKSNLNLAIDSRQLAYTIYTSGSTGSPKGVMIEHHSVVNLILWVNNRFNIGANDRLLFITSMCFDLSVYDIFGILAAGGTLVIAEQTKDINYLIKVLQDDHITFWDSVPSTLEYLIKELELTNKEYRQIFLRTVFLSGDWIPISLPGRVKNFFPEANVISLGGATEATIWSNYFPVEELNSDWVSIPYGKPIANSFFYILDDDLRPVPKGVIGNLFIGGVGVARGYANESEKTLASFIPDPFNKNCGGIMYRTGDLGRMLPDMNMEFIGRKDNQVKIHGFRVELGEIEFVINSFGGIDSAVVLAIDYKDGDKELVGYVVPQGEFDREGIVTYLKQKLPEYMVPVIWIALETMPLNINGKIDRKALSNISISEKIIKPYTAPLTESEKIMTNIWKQVFGIEKIGTSDNFFELGGHSLMALQIMSRFEKQTGTKLSAAALFKNPTISSLMVSVENEDTAKSKWETIVPIKASGSKMPLYIVHGDGLYVLNFKDLAKYVDKEQPLFGLQPADLDGTDHKVETMADIASNYITDILEHNPNGPYAIAGYSFGGYVAVEMGRQLAQMGKLVKMIAIFDTDAENSFYNKSWKVTLKKKVIRQFPKMLWMTKLFVRKPLETVNYQYNLLKRKSRNMAYKLGVLKEPKVDGIYDQIKLINNKHQLAFKNYNILPFNNSVYLFKAEERIYFVDDFKYLGWNKYAQKGVNVIDVPGDHASMLQQPNVSEFGKKLQNALNNC